jgi:hypothetical protein
MFQADLRNIIRRNFGRKMRSDRKQVVQRTETGCFGSLMMQDATAKPVIASIVYRQVCHWKNLACIL